MSFCFTGYDYVYGCMVSLFLFYNSGKNALQNQGGWAGNWGTDTTGRLDISFTKYNNISHVRDF